MIYVSITLQHSSLFDFLKNLVLNSINLIFKISLKVINVFAIRASVGVSNLVIYVEYVFGNLLHSCILICVKLKLFRINNKLLWFY